MTPLLDLPTEVLGLVVHHLGAIFFAQDLRRLTLCKAWYPLAQEEIYSTISITTIGKAYHLLEQFKDNPELALPKWAQELTRSLIVRLSNADDVPFFLRDDLVVNNNLDRFYCVLGGALDYGDRNFLGLGPLRLLEQLRRLARLEIRIVIPEDPPGLRYFEADSFSGTRAAYNSLTRLSRLALPSSLRELDLTLVARARLGENSGTLRLHMCTAVNALLRKLPMLRVAYLASAYVCPDLLAGRGRGALRKLHVDLDMRAHAKYHVAERCGWTVNDGASLVDHRRRVTRLAQDLGAAARKFAETLESPTVFRVVWPDAFMSSVLVDAPESSREPAAQWFYAWDCLAAKALVFEEREPWDCKGLPVDLEHDCASTTTMNKLIQ